MDASCDAVQITIPRRRIPEVNPITPFSIRYKIEVDASLHLLLLHMQITFYKYQGTGNDFIVLDNRQRAYDALTAKKIAALCNRHFGIGADGLMLLNSSTAFDFEMRYFNSDGAESTMCGNGGRCMTAFAKHLGLIQDKARFHAIDGEHIAIVDTEGHIELRMNPVTHVVVRDESFELNTGSPHYVHYIDELTRLDVRKEGALIRYSPLYKEQGINVNFVERNDDGSIFVRTYERGVEDETLSCGTGVTASAITLVYPQLGEHEIRVHTLGGNLQVKFTIVSPTQIDDIWLCGKAAFVFEGMMEV
jgi:diaminopimelate epimerase